MECRLELFLAIGFLSKFLSSVRCDEGEKNCMDNREKGQGTHLFISLRKSEEWDTKFSVERNGSLSSDAVYVDLNQKVVDCSTHRMIKIQGEIKASINSTSLAAIPRFLFHKSCSPNAAITNGGRTLQKYKEGESASAVTNRPLLNDEIFKIRLDKRNSKYPFGFGVTTIAPGSRDFLDHFNDMKSGTWMFYYTNLYTNGPATYTNYIKSEMKEAKEGDVYGVMRSKFGSLHLFVNGVDQGPAAPIPENVYGVLHLHEGGLQATIVD